VALGGPAVLLRLRFPRSRGRRRSRPSRLRRGFTLRNTLRHLGRRTGSLLCGSSLARVALGVVG
jgi:hypothetical protein